ncbi:MAG: acetyl-CoA carboxylase carboxyltransferase subunit beta [Peptoniphilaceae bacterium]|jgi:acetyl-CoA carboxylase carboxyl transferase beta subunit|nr:acetyl-CoA carboxylase carboxyltransferase subunit beta [Bacillota bacterium]
MLKDLNREALEKMRLVKGDDKKIKQVSGQVKRTLLTDGTLSDGGLVMCKAGKHYVSARQLQENLGVCPVCGYHTHLSPRERIAITVDEGSFTEWDAHLTTGDPLQFPAYHAMIQKATETSGSREAVTTGLARIDGEEVVIGVMDNGFLLGTMGTVVGEKITRAIEEAAVRKRPIVLFTASGGARMQEGIFSLMQMAKTSAAMEVHHRAGLLSIVVLTDPTYGGVTASFGMLGDITLAECGARIGFAGPRVIRQTIKEDLPEGFQEAEFIEAHGFCDRTVQRAGLRPLLGRLLRLHKRGADGQ